MRPDQGRERVWAALVEAYVERVASNGPFTTDDVWKEMETHGISLTGKRDVIAHVLHRLRKSGAIYPTDEEKMYNTERGHWRILEWRARAPFVPRDLATLREAWRIAGDAPLITTVDIDAGVWVDVSATQMVVHANGETATIPWAEIVKARRRVT